METEIAEICAGNRWNEVYTEIKREAMMQLKMSTADANKPENSFLNRYRDVKPYDHSRVKLETHHDTDYINASLVKVPRANRKYILAQGPLPYTLGHFWLMVWEQNSKAVLMLNRVIEKRVNKCHQYWPLNEGESLDDEHLQEVGLTLLHVKSEEGEHYTVRTLKLTNTATGESRDILHFHYTAWADFDVPQCDTFLEYLNAVRESGSLEDDVGPPIVHCSAGIGRSGTFCLVDSSLVLIEREGPEEVCIRDILLEMRQSRMGLIQTVDQLRFSYMAITSGAKEASLISPDSPALSAILPGPDKTKMSASSLTSAYVSATSRVLDSSSSSDSSSDFDYGLGPPPLPPPRSESLLGSNSTIGTTEQRLYQRNQQVYVNGNDGSGPGLLLPADIAEMVEAYNDMPQNLAVVNGTDYNAALPDRNLEVENITNTDIQEETLANAGSSISASPTKYILNNHKLEERKRDLELRRRNKSEKNAATEEHLAEIKHKMKESEDWKSKKQYIIDTVRDVVPFVVGLAMVTIGGTYYFYTKT